MNTNNIFCSTPAGCVRWPQTTQNIRARLLSKKKELRLVGRWGAKREASARDWFQTWILWRLLIGLRKAFEPLTFFRCFKGLWNSHGNILRDYCPPLWNWNAIIYAWFNDLHALQAEEKKLLLHFTEPPNKPHSVSQRSPSSEQMSREYNKENLLISPK